MQIYIDESIHEEEGFIVSSYVGTPDSLDEPIAASLSKAGLVPYHDEFKSRMPMDGRPEIQGLREALFGIILKHARLGFLISSTARRKYLGSEILLTGDKLIQRNSLKPLDLTFYLDQGISAPSPMPSTENIQNSQLRFGQDSRTVLGLQLADLAARYGALLLLEKLRGAKKFVFVGKESGYDPGFDAELGWVIRSALRHKFFMEHKEWDESKSGDWYWLRQLLGYGVFLGEQVPERIVAAVEEVYDIAWLGCIH
jgi:hypothetical protein